MLANYLVNTPTRARRKAKKEQAAALYTYLLASEGAEPTEREKKYGFGQSWRISRKPPSESRFHDLALAFGGKQPDQADREE